MVTRSRVLAVPTLLGLLVLAGCVTPEPPRPASVTQTVAAPPAVVSERLREALRAEGMTVSTGADGRVVRGELPALQPDSPWAVCQRVHVRDPDGERLRLADPERLDVQLRAELVPADGATALTLDPVFVQTLRNSFTNLTFTRRCRSAGALERTIFRALNDGRA